MLTKAHPERFFIGSIMLAFAALIMATVGIKPQLLQNLQFLILLVSLLLVIWIGFNAGKFEIITNRLRMQAMGWLIAATCSAAIWSFSQKSTQLIFPALKISPFRSRFTHALYGPFNKHLVIAQP